MDKFLRLINGIPRLVAGPAIYDETYSVSGTITTGNPITLPASGTYNSEELEVRLNGQRLESVVDYNYVGGSPPRTQVAFTFDLVIGDQVNFRVDRVP